MTTEPTAGPRWSERSRSLRCALNAPVDAAWLGVLRVGFGLTLAWSTQRFMAYGWIERLFIEPSVHFKYWGLGWIPEASGPQLHGLFVGLQLLALAVAAGFFFRLAAPLLFLGLLYIQLIDVSTYLNHYYLAALIAGLLSISPAHHVWSIDALRRRWRSPAPSRRPSTKAVWLYLFRFQIFVVYFFAGLGKAQSDWLLHGQPLRIWLGANTDLPLIGSWLAQPGAALLLSWGGFLFDISIGFWLLFSRTRPYAYLAVVVFHLLTRLLFPIGVFPAIMILSATVFFEPDWPRKVAQGFRRFRNGKHVATLNPTSLQSSCRVPLGGLGCALFAMYCVVQLLIPLRGAFYPGNLLWHEQGMRFSWRVMVRAKGGSTTFVVRQKATGRVWHVNPSRYLTGLQESEMSGQADLILQLAHFVESDFARRGLGPVEVQAHSQVTLNGRRSTTFIDPRADLTQVRDTLNNTSWILPAPLGPPPHTQSVL